MSDTPITLSPESAHLTTEEQEAEQRRSQWAQRQALSRVYSIDDMRRFLRCAGSEARAEAWLPTLDEFTRGNNAHAMSYTLSAMWLDAIGPVLPRGDE
jgi:hypothetical protein